MKNSELQKGEILIYQTSRKEVKLEVRLEEETVWLTQKQLSLLFDKGIPTINEHIKNIYKEKELQPNSTIRKFRIVQVEGTRQIEREIELYNLDVIISVGYRVNSKRATLFRIWATKTLKDHLIEGYTVNERRLLEVKEKFQDLQQAVAFIQEKSRHELLFGRTNEILNLLSGYAKTLTLLEEYDTGKITERPGKKAKFRFNYNDCIKIITELKKELINKKEASELFGQERNRGLESIIQGLYQTFGGKELYPCITDKAVHLLYFTIKDHPFIDGNKRIGSFLFVYFLDKNNYLYKKNGEKKINDNTLTALALLVAESQPKEKEIIIKIIKNLLVENL